MLMPTWLSELEPVILKQHIGASEYDPAVDEVGLFHATPNYAREIEVILKLL